MDLDMYKHPSTIANFSSLTQFGNTIIPAESGELVVYQVKEEWQSQKI
jgi:phosphopantothenoylcysteine decarboxylase/phosphopantothenate--cysteine ligase